ncbi:pentapeptide repeat-containing protein [Nocardia yamanashiensis]|uniref:pentapeptide repeat-containing protein n=1 Tax=Nocardia yamanashiensis TaxID=209247 RepID=UPI001E5428FE|nr:pentapeptide repeat-containing protein [Nocardia yamanashiensis]UGT43803.1 pentapeptide repeat-containing protein [Nocardia yamanashiensis]
MAAIAAVLYGAQSLRLAEESSRQQYQLVRREQAVERFARAAEVLGGADSTAQGRLGAIYSLDQIAGEFPGDRFKVVSVVAAFLREQDHSGVPGVVITARNCAGRGSDSLNPPRLGEEFKAAVALVVRYNHLGEFADEAVDLSYTCLEGVRLQRRGVGYIDFSGASLAFAELGGNDLTTVKFSNTDLGDAQLGGSSLRGSVLSGLRLTRASFLHSNLEGARIGNCAADGSGWEGAVLRQAEFHNVDLSGAHLSEADLTGATLRQVTLNGADLTGATLTGVQFDGVRYDAKTKWPVGFSPPPSS